MNIIAVDDNPSDLLNLKETIKIAVPACVLSCFRNPHDALRYANIIPVDVAFIEPDISSMHGLIFAKRLQDRCANVNIVFVAKERYYAREAFSIRASGFVLKPITSARVSKEIENLRNPIIRSPIHEKEPFYSIETEDSSITVPLHSIMCVEYDKRAITFHIENMKPLSKKSFCWRFGKTVAPLLADERFLRARRHCVINVGMIAKITDKSFVLINDMEINIPQKVYAEVKGKLTDYQET